MDWKTFTSIPNGTEIHNHGYSQCVAVANLYHESVVGGSFVPVNSAFEWWTRFEQFPTLVNNYTKSNTPTPGSIFVSRGGIYDPIHGHIGVVTELNKSGYVNTMEQNTGPWYPQRYLYRYVRGMQNMYGFLVPKNNPATRPIKEDDMFTDEDRARMARIEHRVNACYDALFTTEPTSRGTRGGVLKTLKAIDDAQFKTTETTLGTPGGTLVNDRHMLAKLDEIITHLGIVGSDKEERTPR